jgi:hypothetical protein
MFAADVTLRALRERETVGLDHPLPGLGQPSLNTHGGSTSSGAGAGAEEREEGGQNCNLHPLGVQAIHCMKTSLEELGCVL